MFFEYRGRSIQRDPFGQSKSIWNFIMHQTWRRWNRYRQNPDIPIYHKHLISRKKRSVTGAKCLCHTTVPPFLSFVFLGNQQSNSILIAGGYKGFQFREPRHFDESEALFVRNCTLPDLPSRVMENGLTTTVNSEGISKVKGIILYD